MHEFHALGVERLFPVSSATRRGIDDLLDAVTRVLPAHGAVATRRGIRLAVVGRPNVGKSSLLNRLLGPERTSRRRSRGPPATRSTRGHRCRPQPYVAHRHRGLRRAPRWTTTSSTTRRSARSRVLTSCNVALVVLDATRPPENQDHHVAGMAEQSGRGIVLIANKWDIAARDESARAPSSATACRFCAGPRSGSSRRRRASGMRRDPAARQKVAARRGRISTSSLSARDASELWTKHPPPGISNSGLFASSRHGAADVRHLREAKSRGDPAALPPLPRERPSRDRTASGAPIRIHLRKKREKKREMTRDSWAS